MKEYPSEIILTIKKRPRHSNNVGIVVMKPLNITNRKAISSSASSVSASSIANRKLVSAGITGNMMVMADCGGSTVGSVASSNGRDKSRVKPVKKRATVRRRATIGGSPSNSGASGGSTSGGASGGSSGSLVYSIIQDNRAGSRCSVERKHEDESYDTTKDTCCASGAKNHDGKRALPYAKVHPLMGSASATGISMCSQYSEYEKPDRVARDKPIIRAFKLAQSKSK